MMPTKEVLVEQVPYAWWLTWLSYFLPTQIIVFTGLILLKPKKWKAREAKRKPSPIAQPTPRATVVERPAQTPAQAPPPIPAKPPPAQVETTPVANPTPWKKTREERMREYAERKAAEEAAAGEAASTASEAALPDHPADDSPEQDGEAALVDGKQLYMLVSPPQGVDDPLLSIVIRIVLLRAFIRPTDSSAMAGGRQLSEASAWRLSQAQVGYAGANRRCFDEAVEWLLKQRALEWGRGTALILGSVDAAKPAGGALLREALALKRSIASGINLRDEGARA